jgi:hypothetical protein
VGARNRRLYSLFGNPGYEAMIRILASENPVVARLRRGRDAREFLTHIYARRMPRIFQVGALLARAVPRRWEKKVFENSRNCDTGLPRAATAGGRRPRDLGTEQPGQ